MCALMHLKSWKNEIIVKGPCENKNENKNEWLINQRISKSTSCES
jgi:hypothetical protein